MPRRLITAAFAGALALAALTGCRFETAADAAFVGDKQYTTADIDGTIASMKAQGFNTDQFDRNELREDILAESVFRDVAKRYAQEKGYPAPSVDNSSLAQALGLPSDNSFVVVASEAEAYRTLLLSKVAPTQPTDADYHDAFNLLLGQQAVEAGSEAEIKTELQQNFNQELGSGVALRNELTAAMKRYGTEVNPKYLPVGYPLTGVPTQTGGTVTLVQLPLGGTEQAPVRDLVPTAEQTAPGESAQ